MVDIMAVCPVDGPFPVKDLFGGSGSAVITMSRTATRCPRCGRISDIVDGTYDYVGEIITAFRAPGVSRKDIEALKKLAESEKRGEISRENANQEAEKLSSTFADIMKWADGNAALLSVLIAVIACFIAVYGVREADLGSDQAHEDAEQQLRATESVTQAQQRIYEELLRQHAGEQSPAKATPSKTATQQPRPKQTPIAASPNRHERRKMEAEARRRPRT